MPILPPSTLGIVGGGQLGRMFVCAARDMGYEVIVLDPSADSPAGSMASEHLQSAYDDRSCLDYLAEQCAVITTEFENVPAATMQYLAQKKPVHPRAEAVAITQNRVQEKTFIKSLDLATSPFIAIESEADLARAEGFDYPAILKTATLGYDGKGQVVCETAAEVAEAYRAMGQVACVLEQKIDLAKEVSVVLGRNADGQSFCFPLAENEHANGILDVSLVPAAVPPELAQQARQSAEQLAQGLNYVGVMAVEFFVDRDGQLLVNEIAPRTHNTGHYTLDACYSSQFQLQVRMICDLPAGNLNCHSPVAMLNLLGDIWPERDLPPWDAVLDMDNAFLHLYGKKQARKGRKMGHISFLSDDIEQARETLDRARTLLS